MNGNRSQKIGLQILKFANHNHQSISTWKSNKRFARLSGGTFVPRMNCENVIDLQWCCLIPYIISYYRVCSTTPWFIHPIFLFYAGGWLNEGMSGSLRIVDGMFSWKARWQFAHCVTSVSCQVVTVVVRRGDDTSMAYIMRLKFREDVELCIPGNY